MKPRSDMGAKVRLTRQREVGNSTGCIKRDQRRDLVRTKIEMT